MSDTLDDAAVRNKLEQLGLKIVPPERRTPEYLAKLLPGKLNAGRRRFAQPASALISAPPTASRP
jgi:hypothetical protein